MEFAVAAMENIACLGIPSRTKVAFSGAHPVRTSESAGALFLGVLID